MKWEWLDFDHQLAGNDTYLSHLLSSGQNNDIIFQGQHALLLLRGERRALAEHSTNTWIKFKTVWSGDYRSNCWCQASVFPGGNKKEGASLWSRVGAKYFNNSSLTVRTREREREVQQVLMLDAVGAAARGDRLVVVLHEKVSQNISDRMNNNTRNTRSERWARATRRIGQRGCGGGDICRASTLHTPAGTMCVWVVEEAGRDELLLSQATWIHGRKPSGNTGVIQSFYIHVCMN